VPAAHFAGVRGEDAGSGRNLQTLFRQFGQGIQAIGIQQQRAWKIAP
jgi:hypothetical protein